MKLLVRLPLFLFLCVCSTQASEIENEPQKWHTYHNDEYGLSFVYPENLIVTTRNVDFFHIEGLVHCIELVDKQIPNTIALRLMISEPLNNPLAVKEDYAFLRKVCKKYKEITIGGRRAVNCVSCGSAACQWKIVFPGSRQLKVFTMLMDEIEQSEPKNRTYPILSIINSIEFRNGN